MQILISTNFQVLGEGRKNDFLRDMEVLHYLTNEEDFDTGFKLFKEKWNSENPDLVTYFENEWVHLHKNWYLGGTPAGVPSTNNGLESFNSLLKRCYTYRDRLPPGLLIEILQKLIYEFSLKYRNDEYIVSTPTITAEMYKYASKTATNDSLEFLTDSDGNTNLQVLVSSTKCSNLAQVIITIHVFFYFTFDIN